MLLGLQNFPRGLDNIVFQSRVASQGLSEDHFPTEESPLAHPSVWDNSFAEWPHVSAH